MKHEGEIEAHVFRWLQEGYTIADINEERNSAIIRFKERMGNNNVDWIYEV